MVISITFQNTMDYKLDKSKPCEPVEFPRHCLCKNNIQGMVDGSASKPALRQDTGYMVEKTDYDIAPYLGPYGAYLMPQ